MILGLCVFVSPWVVVVSPAHAQRIEAGIGGGWMGGAAMGTQDAELRPNTEGRDPFRLFSTDTRFGSASLLEARAAWWVTRRYAVEARVGVSRPELQTSVTADVEDAAPLTIVERVDQYVVDAGIVIALDEIRLGALVPFAAAGAGYLRQLHEGGTLVEQGHLYHVGGGVRYALFRRLTGALKAAGLRADARLYLLEGGIALEGGPRPHTAVSGSFFVAF